MKDIINRVIIGSIVAIISITATWLLARHDKPDVQLLIDRPLQLPAGRIVVFKVINAGGGMATNITVKFVDAVLGSSIIPITPASRASSPGAGPEVQLAGLRPKEEESFYIKDAPTSIDDVKLLITKAVYEQGDLSVYTNNDRLKAYGRTMQFSGGILGFMAGVTTLLAFIGLGAFISSSKNRRSHQTPTSTLTTTQHVIKE